MLPASWLSQAVDQMRQDSAAYQAQGVPGLLQDMQSGQDLAGGFGGNIKSVGRLTPVYHATNKEFTTFDNSKSVRQAYGAATHVAADPELANMFARQFNEGARIMPLQANLGKIADAQTFKEFANRHDWDIPKTTQALIDAGYDSVQYNHGTFHYPTTDGKLAQSTPGQDLAYAILNPENIFPAFGKVTKD